MSTVVNVKFGFFWFFVSMFMLIVTNDMDEFEIGSGEKQVVKILGVDLTTIGFYQGLYQGRNYRSGSFHPKKYKYESYGTNIMRKGKRSPLILLTFLYDHEDLGIRKESNSPHNIPKKALKNPTNQNPKIHGLNCNLHVIQVPSGKDDPGFS